MQTNKRYYIKVFLLTLGSCMLNSWNFVEMMPCVNKQRQ
jgi:hypothetical protein